MLPPHSLDHPPNYIPGHSFSHERMRTDGDGDEGDRASILQTWKAYQKDTFRETGT